MKIFVGTDHAGFRLKERIVQALKKKGYEVVDKGAYEYNQKDDYPDFIIPVAREVSKDPDNAKGIILGATGEGEAMAANRFPNVRATVYYGKAPGKTDNEESEIIKKSRQDNNANILSLGAKYLSEKEMLEAVRLWLSIPFSGEERHIRRLREIDEGR